MSTPKKQEKVGARVMLGKLEAKEEEGILQFAEYADMKKLARKVGSHVNYSRALKPRKNQLPMYENDKLPDCTCAAVGHAARVFSYNAGTPKDPTDEDVLAMFDATGSRDEGRYVPDILDYWQDKGFGPEAEKIGAYVQVNHRERAEVEAAMSLFGGVYAGLALPVTAQAQEKWTVGKGKDAEPNSWGGQAVFVPDFTKMRGPVCISWGELLPMSWGFWRAYADECYAVLSPDWVDGSRKAPTGFALATLQEDLQK